MMSRLAPVLPALALAILLTSCTGGSSQPASDPVDPPRDSSIPDDGTPQPDSSSHPDTSAQPDSSTQPDTSALPDAAKPDVPAIPDASQDSDDATKTQQLSLVFVHGFEGSDARRAVAQDDLKDVEAYVLDAIGARAAAYEAKRGVKLLIQSRRVNLYTDLQDQLLSPSLDSEGDGTGIATANHWREQLAAKIQQAYPNGERNLVLVGHSTGGRVSVEVAANVGDNSGPESHDWGLQDRIAGVVTAHGAIDALDSPAYDFTGPTSFHFGCALVNEVGICDYLSYISGTAAADSLALQGRALMLTSQADCGLSAWTGASDQTLPTAAMGSPHAWGMTLVPANGKTLVPAHGYLYGEFCHSDLTDSGSPRHQSAVAALGEQVLDWLFVAAPRVANPDSPDKFIETSELPAGTPSPSYPVLADCGPAALDLGVPEVVGVCLHPGLLDGDDHAVDSEGLMVTDGADCGGSFVWKHSHQGEEHAARLWYKSYSVPAGGGLLSALN
ncbi:MAG: hypothetical protein HY898_17645 [Deltaproteobacteria bacterium]|nr:hypothetical protein [Deltaproteobacteria bacterium]